MSVCDVRVGDVGTVFKGELLDVNADGTEEAYDPSAAAIKRLTWRQPDGTVLQRNAFVTTEGAGVDQRWFLQYLTAVTEPDFHAQAGRYVWQGYVEFADGKRYHTDTAAYVVQSNLD